MSHYLQLKDHRQEIIIINNGKVLEDVDAQMGDDWDNNHLLYYSEL